MLLLATLLTTPGLTAPNPQVPTVEAADPSDEERSNEDAEDLSSERVWEGRVDLGLLGSRDGVLGVARASAFAPSDAFAQLDMRLAHSGDGLARVAGGVDVLGGGRAHLLVGGFVGLGVGLDKAAAPMAPQAGALVGLGYDDAHVGLGWQGRLGAGGPAGQGVLLENELVLAWKLHPNLALTGSWLRTGRVSQSEDAFGGGIRASF